ncbi:hypothetical protein WME82_35685 [Sorangium sp. So ce128]
MVRSRSDAADVPPGLARLAAEPVPRQRRDDDVERVGRVAAVRGLIRERADQVVELIDPSRPAVNEEERYRIWPLAARVPEVEIDTVDLAQILGSG